MDNSESRLNDVFFYGLYMDPEVLDTKGVEPRKPRKGMVKGYCLRVGKMATLLKTPNSEAHGMVYSLTHDEINKLYRGAGLDAYVAEALLVQLEDNEQVAALCCNLLVPPGAGEENPEYVTRLIQCMNKLGLPLPDA